MTRTKTKNAKGLFDQERRMEEIEKIKTPLDKLNDVIDWEIFRSILNNVFDKKAKGAGGASHYDYVFMFKVMVFQRYYNLSDAQTEFRIKVDLSVQKFLGITIADKVPDEKKIWHFKEKLTKAEAIEKLFNKFDEYLSKKGVIGKEGSIVDASFVEVPRQRNTREENKSIKDGKIPPEWEENPHKLRQKDTDARWTTKNKERHCGYKNSIKASKKLKLIEKYTISSASVHDSQAINALLDENDRGKKLWADSAYSGNPINNILKEKGIINKINEKGYRNKPLTKAQKESNRIKSKTRAQVEHIFGFMRNSMHLDCIRTIGEERARTTIGLMNIVYNMCRFEQIKRLGIA